MTRLAALFALLSIAACGGSSASAPATPTSASTRPSCEAIDEACEQGSGAAKECHDFAEASASTEASCAARRVACIELCTSKQK